MRTALSIAALGWLATALASGQEPAPPPPIPGEEAPAAPPAPKQDPVPKAEPVAPAAPEAPAIKAVRIPLGVRDAKPSISSAEKLMRDSETAMVDGDQLWLTIDHSRGAGVTSIDIDRSGFCFVMERLVVDGELLPTVIRAGRGVPAAKWKAMLAQARKKSVLFGVGRDRIVQGGAAERMSLGVAARMGLSVHSSQSIPFDQFPPEVRQAAVSLLESARKLPVVTTAKGILNAEFVPPQQARRLTVLSGKRLIAVRDPGKEATVLPPAVAAARMPGRRVVVTDELEWERIRGYLTSGGLVQEPASNCLISVGAHVYRLTVEAL